jgi:hypothetical protein
LKSKIILMAEARSGPRWAQASGIARVVFHMLNEKPIPRIAWGFGFVLLPQLLELLEY